MSDDSRGADDAANRVAAMLRAYLLKSAIRIPAWMLVAWAITSFYPAAAWAWYVVYAFVGIAVAWSAFLFILLYRLTPDDEPGGPSGVEHPSPTSRKTDRGQRRRGRRRRRAAPRCRARRSLGIPDALLRNLQSRRR